MIPQGPLLQNQTLENHKGRAGCSHPSHSDFSRNSFVTHAGWVLALSYGNTVHFVEFLGLQSLIAFLSLFKISHYAACCINCWLFGHKFSQYAPTPWFLKGTVNPIFLLDKTFWQNFLELENKDIFHSCELHSISHEKL